MIQLLLRRLWGRNTRRRQKRLLDLVGKLDWETGFDYKAERSRNIHGNADQ
jgi:hypothetical protein